MSRSRIHPSAIIAVLTLLAGCGGGSWAPADDARLEPDGPWADSVFEVNIEGNDGSDPGDALYVGQTSRLIARTSVVERRPGGKLGVAGRWAKGARVRFRSLSPRIVGVDSAGRVRALSLGAGRVEASAYLDADPSTPVAVDTMPFRVLAPDPAGTGPRFSEVSTAHVGDFETTCGITVDGAVACFPYAPGVHVADGGERGVGMLPAPAGARFHGVAVGGAFACALDAEGRAFCWGTNDRGQLGNPDARETGPAVPAATDARFTRLAAGFSHACGITAQGQVLCWGLSLSEAAGPTGVDRCTVRVEREPHRPSPEPRPCARVPRPVPAPGRATDVVAGGDHTCVLVEGGALYCWGGVYNIRFASRTPRRVGPESVRLARIASGDQHVCGVDGQGGAWCWGRNWRGQLGSSVPREGSPVLARVADVPPLRSIAAGGEHTCGIALSGGAFCWGYNWNAQLGGGTVDDDGVVRVAGDHAWSALAAGPSHTCGLTVAGAVYCWGSGLAFRWEPGGLHEQPEPFPVSGWR